MVFFVVILLPLIYIFLGIDGDDCLDWYYKKFKWTGIK